jgi:hypothetical protein
VIVRLPQSARKTQGSWSSVSKRTTWKQVLETDLVLIYRGTQSAGDGVLGSAEEGSQRPPHPADEQDDGHDKRQGNAAADVRMHG